MESGDLILATSARPAPVIVRTASAFDPLRPSAVQVHSFAEGLRIRDLAPADLGPEWVAYRTKACRPEPLDPEQLVEPGWSVVFIGVPGAEVKLGVLLLNLAISAAVGIAIGFVSRALIGSPEKPTEPEDEGGTYGWQGIRTAYGGFGLVAPLVYGSIAQGGVAIQESVRIVQEGGKPRSILTILLLLSTGPVKSVCGIEEDADFIEPSEVQGLKIQGNDAANYSGVTLYVRLGTNEQAVIPGFANSEIVYAVDLPLDQEDPALGGGDWSKAARFRLTNEADRIRAIIGFPQGLYTLSSGGAVLLASVQLSLRYRTTDTAGNPTSDWQVSEQNPIVIAQALQSPFEVAIEQSMITPGTPAPIDAGIAVNTGGQTYLRVVNQTIAGPQSDWSPGSKIGSWGSKHEATFTWTVWIPADETSFPDPLGRTWVGGWLRFIADIDTASTSGSNWEGIGLRVLPGVTSGTVRLQAFVGRAASFLPGFTLTASQTRGGWAQVVLRLRNGRQQLYVNGTLRASNTAILQNSWTWPSSGRWTVGALDQFIATTNPLPDVIVDQVACWQRELQVSEIVALWNGGLPVPIKPNNQHMPCLWPFEGDALNLAPWDNDLEWAHRTGGTPSPVFTNGVVLQTSSTTGGTLALYEVEIKRNDTPSNSPQVRDEARWASVVGIASQAPNYGGCALLGLEIDATDQLNTSRPDVIALVEGQRLCPIYSESSEAWYFGYSRNPAWVFAAVATDRVQGLGRFTELDDLDETALLGWAAHCDELVPDQRGRRDVVGMEVVQVEADVYVLDIYADVIPPPHWVDGTQLRFFDWTVGTAPGGAWDVLIGLVLSAAADLPTQGPAFEDSIDGVWRLRVRLDGSYWSSAATTIANAEAQGFIDFDGLGWAMAVEALEPRHTCDISFDKQGRGGWSALEDVCRSGRAVPARLGRRLTVRWDAPREPSMLFNSENIVAGSMRMQVAPAWNRANRATMEILDRDADWQRTPVARDHASLNTGPETAIVRQIDLRTVGITRRSHARRELTALLNATQLQRLGIQFEASIDAIFCVPGDRVLVEHPIGQWGWGGYVTDASSAENKLRIDKPLTLQASVTYRAVLQSKTDNELYYAQVLSPAGDYEAGDVLDTQPFLAIVGGISINRAPDRGDRWAIGRTEVAVRDYRVTDLEVAPDTMQVTVRAVEYNASVYDEVDFGEPTPFAWGSELAPPDVTEAVDAILSNVALQESTAFTTSGRSAEPALILTWEFKPPFRNPAQGQTGGYTAQIEIVVTGSSDRQVRTLPAETGRATIVGGLEVHRTTTARITVLPPRGVAGGPVHGVASIYLTGQVYSPAPPPPPGVEVVGELVAYRSGGVLEWGHVELRRGAGWALADLLGVLPAEQGGGTQTRNYVVAPTHNGRGTPRIQSRALVGTTVGQPAWETLPPIVDLGDELVSVSLEDEGWLTAEAEVSGLEVYEYDPEDGVHAPGDALRFTGALPGGGTGLYTSRVFDLGEARPAQIMATFEGEQIHPSPVELLPWAEGSRHASNWCMTEGPLDRADPRWGLVVKRVQIRTSATGDPTGGEWRKFTPGLYRCRSFQFRVALIRPATQYVIEWQVRLYRGAVTAYAPVPAPQPDLVDEGTY